MEDWARSVIDRLAAELATAAATSPHRYLDAESARGGPLGPWEQIAADLFSTALTNGLVVSDQAPTFRSLHGGNTAMQVSAASLAIDFVFKRDSNPKLVREAVTIRDLKADTRLGAFRQCLPKIYAIYDESPPYAYLMEYFRYPSLQSIFFDESGFPNRPTAQEAETLAVNSILPLFEAYDASIDHRQQVRMMGEAYFDRIELSLKKAEAADNRFAPRPIVVNGTLLRSWMDYLGELRNRKTALQALAAPFVTVVHGDPNPGNILVDWRGGRVWCVKFIDLKDWKTGDYIFDLAKITHFLRYTGPVEFLNAASSLTATSDKISYELSVLPYVESAVSVAERKLEALANRNDDAYWRLRYEFALAANLLGLIAGRVEKGRSDAALVLYAEGMLRLRNFTESFLGAQL